MKIEWRTLQLFLGDEGISEVSVDATDIRKVKCNCRAFQRVARCKHASYVREKLDNNNGAYDFKVPDYLQDDEVELASQDVDRFRDFIIKYGKVEVI